MLAGENSGTTMGKSAGDNRLRDARDVSCAESAERDNENPCGAAMLARSAAAACGDSGGILER
jgi:hypothetical protein